MYNARIWQHHGDAVTSCFDIINEANYLAIVAFLVISPNPTWSSRAPTPKCNAYICIGIHLGGDVPSILLSSKCFYIINEGKISCFIQIDKISL
jgi:hypothetical protein